MNRRRRKKAPLWANYSIANYLKTDSKAMVTQILDTLIENAVNHSKIVATEIIVSSYCRKLEVGGTLMSPHTTDFNTLGSS
jgi:hypothetical protein